MSEAETLSLDEIRFLLQTASILTFEVPSDDESYLEDPRVWAYDVSTRLLEAFGQSIPTVAGAAEYILCRLGNFPGRDLLREKFATNWDQSILRSPALRLEALVREAENSIEYPHLGTRLLTDFQHRLNEALNRSKAVSVSAPTSAGKSFILAHDIVATVSSSSGQVVVYVVPTRALIQQVTGDLLQLFRKAKLPEVIVSAAPIEFSEEEAKPGVVYVLTQERLISLLGIRQLKLDIAKIYVDEAQEISDSERGLILDSAVRQVIQRFPKVHICFASPLTKNPGYLFEEFEIREQGEFFRETFAPVSQVLVNIEPVSGEPKAAKVSVISPRGVEEVGEAKLSFKLRGTYDPLAGTAMQVRSDGESVIIYANRPHDAMEIADKVAASITDNPVDTEVVELINFVKAHVHPKYSLADVLVKGVAFHYGRMPHVIRNQVEELLRNRKLNYVVSTSTLLQGVNLPARHIVVLNPKKGNKTPMETPDFWNLVGRAGRLRENFRGIVWCIAPSRWETKPLEGERLSEIKSAFQASLEDDEIREAAVAVLEEKAPVSMVKNRNRVEQFIGKTFAEFTLHDGNLSSSSRVPENLKENLVPIDNLLSELRKKLKVPEEVCSLNAVIAPTLLNDLWDRFSTGVTSKMIPVDPFRPKAIDNFRTVFQIIEEVFIRSGKNSWKYFATLAYHWVMGKSLRELIDNRLAYFNVDTSDRKKVNKHIRELLDDIEKALHFTYVRYLKAYLDVLREFLLSQKKTEQAEALSPWDLFVEFGARDRVLLQLMSIGVSRSTAILIRPAIKSQQDISRQECWTKLKHLPLKVLQIPEVCKEEIRKLTGTRN
ncbi:DEAD/DEAH box helicase [Planctomicrobium sp. SH668]|uniref:DEAD/DEAH box helicase n=1 Tax=Planctomicrobium sp. SH668 TaxID=3448126 RepID=UPI003F5C460C